MLFIYSKSRGKTKQTKSKASIDVSHNFGGRVLDKNAQGKCLTAELISMDRMTY